jgi:hypothetical protein
VLGAKNSTAGAPGRQQAETPGYNVDIVGQARGGHNGQVWVVGERMEAGEGLGVQSKCSALWTYWDATKAYEPGLVESQRPWARESPAMEARVLVEDEGRA